MHCGERRAFFRFESIKSQESHSVPAVCVGERDRGAKNQTRMKDRSRLGPPTGEVRNFQKNSREYCDYECM